MEEHFSSQISVGVGRRCCLTHLFIMAECIIIWTLKWICAQFWSIALHMGFERGKKSLAELPPWINTVGATVRFLAWNNQTRLSNQNSAKHVWCMFHMRVIYTAHNRNTFYTNGKFCDCKSAFFGCLTCQCIRVHPRNQHGWIWYKVSRHCYA